MKKFLTFMLISMFLMTFVSSCHKDIPKDIPDWLREKIKEIKKEKKGKNYCLKDICMTIDEYTNGTNIIYWFQPGFTPIGYKIYNYEGVEQCYFESITPNDCGDILNLQDYDFRRRIWKETE